MEGNNQNNHSNHQHDDEISLKELLVALFNYKRLIIGVTVITLVLGGVYAFALAKPVYESSVSGVIKIPETADTKYGVYNYPSTNKMDYLSAATSHSVLKSVIKDLKLDTTPRALKGKINVTSELELNGFYISVKAGSASEAEKIAKSVAKNMVDELALTYKENAIQAFIRDLKVQDDRNLEEMDRNKQVLKSMEEELKTIPKVITLNKLVTSDPVLAAEIAKERGVDLSNLSKEYMLEEIVNENYTLAEQKIIDLKKAINDMEIYINNSRKMQEELKTELAALNLYYETGDESTLNPLILDVIHSKVVINNQANTNDEPVAPRKMLIVAIATVLGLMLGVFSALFKHYWKSN